MLRPDGAGEPGPEARAADVGARVVESREGLQDLVHGLGRDAGATVEHRECHAVAMTPGLAFGEAGEGHIRLSFATSDELLAKAVKRIGDTIGWE